MLGEQSLSGTGHTPGNSTRAENARRSGVGTLGRRTSTAATVTAPRWSFRCGDAGERARVPSGWSGHSDDAVTLRAVGDRDLRPRLRRPLHHRRIRRMVEVQHDPGREPDRGHHPRGHGDLVNGARVDGRHTPAWCVPVGCVPHLGWIWILVELGFLRGTPSEGPFGPASTGRTVTPFAEAPRRRARVGEASAERGWVDPRSPITPGFA